MSLLKDKIKEKVDNVEIIQDTQYEEYTEKKLDGKQDVFEDGVLVETNFYNKGEKLPKYYTYYSDGSIKEAYDVEEYYDEETGVTLKNGSYIVYDENKKVEKKEQYKNGELDGECVDKDYGYTTIANYKNGILNGAYVRYYENGNKKVEKNYINGKISGEVKEYYLEGGIQIVSNYKEDKLEGPYMGYYESGKIKEKNTFKNNNVDGEMIVYYENGKVKTKGKAVNGQLQGELNYYYEDGKIKEKRVMKIKR